MTVRFSVLALAFAAMPVMSEVGKESVVSHTPSIETSKPNAKKYKKKPISYFWARHRFEVSLANDKIIKVRYLDRKTQRVLIEVFPHGRQGALIGGAKKKLFKVKEFRSFMKARAKRLRAMDHTPRKAASASTERVGVLADSSPTQTSSGMPLGLNPSTGWVATSNCYNFTAPLNDPPVIATSFSSEETASTNAGQTNVSASVSGSYGAFKASDSFSFSNSYDNSSASGDVFFNAYAVYTASPVLSPNSPFNSVGTQAAGDGSFSTLCGSNFITSTNVGMLISGQLSYSTSSAATSSSISDTFSASYGLDQINAAVSTATSSSTVSSEFGFTLTMLGGTEQAVTDMTTAYSNNESYMDSCFNGNTADCTTFVNNLNTGAMNAVNDFTAAISNYTTDVSSQAASLEIFPYGVQGVLNSETASYSPLNAILEGDGYDDVLSSYAAALDNYLTVMNQIATLNNRVGYLQNALATPNTYSPPTYSPTMNPAPAFDISNSYLQPLGNAYFSDQSRMLTNLGNCLAATSSNVSTVCEPVTALYGTGSQAIIGSAYEWYTNTDSLTGSSYAPNNFAAQNTIALQYASTVSVANSTSTSFPLDVMWVAQLPSFPPSWQGLPSGISAPSLQSALVSFADAPYYWPGSGDTVANFTSPYVLIMPTGSLTTMSTPASNYGAYGFNFAEYGNEATLGWQGGSGADATTYYPNGCNGYSPAYPTFTNPCGITTSYGSASSSSTSVQATLGQIPNFFGN